jgi:hypothetical protein
MTDTPELDAAIVAGFNGKRAANGLTPYPSNRFAISKDDRTYARALIGKLLEGLDRVENPVSLDDFDDGYNAALADVRRIAGIEEVGHGNS